MDNKKEIREAIRKWVNKWKPCYTDNDDSDHHKGEIVNVDEVLRIIAPFL